MRYTPDNITKLEPNEIFVFGSNTGGRHGAGAARTALDKFGAIYGQGEGLQGQSYGLPTVHDRTYYLDTMSILDIKKYVYNFLETTRNHKDLTFLVTQVGCGLGGWTVDDIAPIFSSVIEFPEKYGNVVLPKQFVEVIKKNKE